MSRTNKIKISLTEDQVCAVIGLLYTDKFQTEVFVEQPALRAFREVFGRRYEVTCETLDEIMRQYNRWRERNEKQELPE